MITNIIELILRRIPRPNYGELPNLYEELDNMARRIGIILISSELFDSDKSCINFDRATEDVISNLIERDPGVMVPFFVMICGFSVRELERLYGIKNVYSLMTHLDREKLANFAQAITENLRGCIHIEALLYKFYKNWEEHQKRHYRGSTAEKFVIEFLKKNGYKADKIKVKCKDKVREIDCAIPPDPQNLQVIVMIRYGVFRDLVKRAKEFSSEFDELSQCFPNAKFVVVYFVSPHESSKLKEVYERIESERVEKRPYDLVILTKEDLSKLLEKLKEWGIRT
jgi:vacuolar-type H+-ATPase subunit F/Vma7